MVSAAADLEFGEAARCRDEIKRLEELAMARFPNGGDLAGADQRHRQR